MIVEIALRVIWLRVEFLVVNIGPLPYISVFCQTGDRVKRLTEEFWLLTARKEKNLLMVMDEFENSLLKKPFIYPN